LKTDNLINLPDGRKLAYAEYGKPDGHPIMHFHGSMSSRLEPLFFGDDLLNHYGLRFIALDRPGMGQSDFQPNRGFTDWTKDVVFLADSLNIEQFSVLAISGGAGYAAVCAAKIPDRLLSVVIVSGGWQVDDEAVKNTQFPLNLLLIVARKLPFLLSAMLKISNLSFQGSPEKVLAQMKKSMPTPDYKALAQSGKMDVFLQPFIEALRRGTKGAAWDFQLIAHNWDFGLEEIQIPLILFHGEQDRSVPVENVRRKISSSLPTARLVTYQDEGHISIIINRYDEVFKALTTVSYINLENT
jgi:pimeloyl-ACP methyl ester carboxylesterase